MDRIIIAIINLMQLNYPAFNADIVAEVTFFAGRRNALALAVCSKTEGGEDENIPFKQHLPHTQTHAPFRASNTHRTNSSLRFCLSRLDRIGVCCFPFYLSFTSSTMQNAIVRTNGSGNNTNYIALLLLLLLLRHSTASM